MNSCEAAIISEERVLTALVVDDDPGQAGFLCRVMGKDYPVLYASGGEEALRVAVVAQPDVILLNAALRHGSDGLVTFSELGKRHETRDIPVVIIGRMDEMEDLEFVVDETGRIPAAFLWKPVMVTQLREEVAQVLRESCAIRDFQEA